mmetsp:Transcript_10172/g.12575  ORF Transcript_10172/g.12575 Transcript_10172/m.12575 type:complete len:178 (+) Transcript_10172:260-793(+)
MTSRVLSNISIEVKKITLNISQGFLHHTIRYNIKFSTLNFNFIDHPFASLDHQAELIPSKNSLYQFSKLPPPNRNEHLYQMMDHKLGAFLFVLASLYYQELAFHAGQPRKEDNRSILSSLMPSIHANTDHHQFCSIPRQSHIQPSHHFSVAWVCDPCAACWECQVPTPSSVSSLVSL